MFSGCSHKSDELPSLYVVECVMWGVDEYRKGSGGLGWKHCGHHHSHQLPPGEGAPEEASRLGGWLLPAK